jgi:hypothetical protein
VPELTLLTTTGDQRIDDLLRRLIGVFELALPQRMRGYFLLGSYADGTAVDLSDLDLLLVFSGQMTAGERATAAQLSTQCAQLSPLRLDLTARGEAELAGETVLLKLGSMLLYGADIRASLALPPLDEYTRTALDSGCYFLRQVLRGAAQLSIPLTYPDPAGEFYGYDTIRIREWYPPGATQGIKELVTSTSRVARALLALQAGQYAGRKSAIVALYRAHIGDPWSDYLEALSINGKTRWQYRVPAAPDERQLLRALCQRTLAFEWHFFTVYRTHLRELLRSPDPDHRHLAIARCGEVCYPDAEVAAASAAATATDV